MVVMSKRIRETWFELVYSMFSVSSRLYLCTLIDIPAQWLRAASTTGRQIEDTIYYKACNWPANRFIISCFVSSYFHIFISSNLTSAMFSEFGHTNRYLYIMYNFTLIVVSILETTIWVPGYWLINCAIPHLKPYISTYSPHDIVFA